VTIRPRRVPSPRLTHTDDTDDTDDTATTSA
jgi:hypothetical protein